MESMCPPGSLSPQTTWTARKSVYVCVCALAVRQKSASPTTLVSPRCVPGAGMDLTLTVQATLISPQRSHSATSADNGRLCEGSADGRSGFVGVFFLERDGTSKYSGAHTVLRSDTHSRNRLRRLALLWGSFLGSARGGPRSQILSS